MAFLTWLTAMASGERLESGIQAGKTIVNSDSLLGVQSLTLDFDYGPPIRSQAWTASGRRWRSREKGDKVE
jgi:hypothetical protein